MELYLFFCLVFDDGSLVVGDGPNHWSLNCQTQRVAQPDRRNRNNCFLTQHIEQLLDLYVRETVAAFRATASALDVGDFVGFGAVQLVVHSGYIYIRKNEEVNKVPGLFMEKIDLTKTYEIFSFVLKRSLFAANLIISLLFLLNE
jgi:hypothetical protein